METTRYPGRAWEMVDAPEEMGWSSDHLSRAKEYAASIGSVAVMVVTQGAALAMWGEVARPLNCRSIRKALLSALYGVHVAEGHIDLAWTLADLGIDDTEPALLDEIKKHQKQAEATTRECSFCLNQIPIKATRCGFCTSQVGPGGAAPTAATEPTQQ